MEQKTVARCDKCSLKKKYHIEKVRIVKGK